MTKKPASYCLVLDDLPRKRHTTLGWEFCVRKHIGKVQVVSCARLDPDNLPLYHFADQRNQTLVNRQYVISINDLAVDPLNLNEAVELISHCFKTSNSMVSSINRCSIDFLLPLTSCLDFSIRSSPVHSSTTRTSGSRSSRDSRPSKTKIRFQCMDRSTHDT